MFGTGCDDSSVLNVLASFLSATRRYELADVVNSVKGCLSAFTNLLDTTNILVVGEQLVLRHLLETIVQQQSF